MLDSIDANKVGTTARASIADLPRTGGSLLAPPLPAVLSPLPSTFDARLPLLILSFSSDGEHSPSSKPRSSLPDEIKSNRICSTGTLRQCSSMRMLQRLACRTQICLRHCCASDRTRAMLTALDIREPRWRMRPSGSQRQMAKPCSPLLTYTSRWRPLAATTKPRSVRPLKPSASCDHELLDSTANVRSSASVKLNSNPTGTCTRRAGSWRSP